MIGPEQRSCTFAEHLHFGYAPRIVDWLVVRSTLREKAWLRTQRGISLVNGDPFAMRSLIYLVARPQPLVQGSMTATPAALKALVSRVATANPRETAIAAM